MRSTLDKDIEGLGSVWFQVTEIVIFAFFCTAYFSNVKFEDMPLSEQTLKAVKELGFT